MNSTKNTKRIAKNTLVLYLRMIVVMIVSLFTARVTLRALGVEDYGLYNVVGGVVTLFAFLRSSMEKATQRFLNVEMVNSAQRANDVFCTSLVIHVVIILGVVLLTETVGLWFLNTYIQIPSGRESAANWVYQMTILSLCLTVLSIPYSSVIIANERMGFYALVSIVDAVFKLGIAYFIMTDTADRLVLYGILMMLISLINFVLYALYCLRKYHSMVKFRFVINRGLFKEIFSFVSWTFVGQVAIVGVNQGNNILVNMFLSVTANAAMSIGSQVNGAVTSLTSSFQTAFNPQITKSYALKDFDYLRNLVFATSKLSYFLLYVVSLSVMCCINDLLALWLDVVPPNAGEFCILFLCNGILNALSAPLNFCVMATGKIKAFQIATSLVYLSDLFVLYALFMMGLPAVTAMFVKVSVMIVVLLIRLWYAHQNIPSIGIGMFFLKVMLPIAVVSCLSIAITYVYMLSVALSNIPWIVNAAFVFFTCVLCVVAVGLTAQERRALSHLFIKIIYKKC